MLHEINLWASVPLGQCVESVGRVCTSTIPANHLTRARSFRILEGVTCVERRGRCGRGRSAIVHRGLATGSTDNLAHATIGLRHGTIIHKTHTTHITRCLSYCGWNPDSWYLLRLYRWRAVEAWQVLFGACGCRCRRCPWILTHGCKTDRR